MTYDLVLPFGVCWIKDAFNEKLPEACIQVVFTEASCRHLAWEVSQPGRTILRCAIDILRVCAILSHRQRFENKVSQMYLFEPTFRAFVLFVFPLRLGCAVFKTYGAITDEETMIKLSQRQ